MTKNQITDTPKEFLLESGKRIVLPKAAEIQRIVASESSLTPPNPEP